MDDRKHQCKVDVAIIFNNTNVVPSSAISVVLCADYCLLRKLTLSQDPARTCHYRSKFLERVIATTGWTPAHEGYNFLNYINHRPLDGTNYI